MSLRLRKPGEITAVDETTSCSSPAVLESLTKKVLENNLGILRSLSYVAIDVRPGDDGLKDGKDEKVDPKSLSPMVREKSLDALAKFGGVSRLASVLETDLENGLSGDDETDLARRKNVFGENRSAVESCKNAGVNIKMITGDNVHTARAIAIECGILETPKDNSKVDEMIVEGVEFRNFSPEERFEAVDKIRLMARSSPFDKLLMVQTLKQKGHFKGRSIFRVGEVVKNTIVFNCFVLCQVFNEFNARKLEEKNVFKGLHKNKLFIGIIGVTLVFQVLMIEFLKKFANTERLGWTQWAACIGIASLTWPIGWLVKCIPVSSVRSLLPRKQVPAS
ncbi:hypothetical protein CRG98_034733 [Punica granatum]|uniref:Cation-transporting P-type ATPase C-terminal domain-containing protein n=1 Tax=Punica granatum TaxID=22663 RepID=A0A2I0IL96_PUNGR|nr:hypothetical protein CRG98_034733 [Punica granatum]